MTKRDQNEKYLIAFEDLTDVDHDALIALGYRLSATFLTQTDETTRNKQAESALQTLKNYSNAYRFLLGNIGRHEKGILEEQSLTVRLTPKTISRMIAAHENRLRASSMASILRDISKFASRCVPSLDCQFIREQACVFEAKAKLSEGAEKGYAIPESELPPQLEGAFERLRSSGKSATANTGEFLRYVGAQKAAGVELAGIDINFLATSEAVANFWRLLPKTRNQATRINSLRCLLKLADSGLNVEPVAARYRELYKDDSGTPDLSERRACGYEDLPEEVKARFEFATTYDGASSFFLNGEDIALPKALRINGMEFSSTHIDAMSLALRHLYTILSAVDIHFANDIRRWAEREGLIAFQAFYADADLVTQTSRLEEVISALRAIFGDAERKMFEHERHQIRRMTAMMKLFDSTGIGFDLREAGKINESCEAPEPPSTDDLSIETIKVAASALQRLGDLKATPLRYRDPSRLAALFRTALIVAFLAEHPLRLRALAGLTKEHLKRPKPRKFLPDTAKTLPYKLDVPGALTKTGKPYHGTCSDALSDLFDQWFAEVRPILVASHTDISALFISDEGLPLSRSAFQTNLPAFTAKYFSFRIYPHLFRKLHGTELVGDRDAAARRLHHGNRESQIPYQDGRALRDQDRGSSLRQQTAGFFTVSTK